MTDDTLTATAADYMRKVQNLRQQCENYELQIRAWQRYARALEARALAAAAERDEARMELADLNGVMR